MFNKKNKLKTNKRFRYRKKISSTVLDVALDGKESILSLKVDGSFKMVVIAYKGSLDRIIKRRFTKLRVIHDNRRKKIIIFNPYRVKLKNNILFAYRGNIEKFLKANIYGWGQMQFPVKFNLPNKERDNINMNQNLISSHDTIMR